MESTVSKTSWGRKDFRRLLPTARKGNHMFFCYLESRVPTWTFGLNALTSKLTFQPPLVTSMKDLWIPKYKFKAKSPSWLQYPVHACSTPQSPEDTNGNSTECLSLPLYHTMKFKTAYTSYLNKLRTPSNPSPFLQSISTLLPDKNYKIMFWCYSLTIHKI